MIRLTVLGSAAAAMALLAACNDKTEPAPAASASAPATPAAMASETPAPAPTAAQTTPAAQESPPMVIAGGFAPADVNDPEVKAALAVATAELYKKFPQRGLVEKTAAQVQVVAGLNYAFDIQMTGGKHYKAVVYKDLKGKMSVTSVEALP